MANIWGNCRKIAGYLYHFRGNSQDDVALLKLNLRTVAKCHGTLYNSVHLFVTRPHFLTEAHMGHMSEDSLLRLMLSHN